MSSRGMKTFCEIYVRYVLPAVRALLARKLIQSYSMTQTEAAKILGITQAAINYYLRGKRCAELIRSLERIPEINELVDKIAEDISENEGANAGPFLCDFCMIIKSNREYLNKVLRALRVRKNHVVVRI